MSLEMQVAVYRLIVPAVFALIGSLILVTIETKDYWNEDEPVRGAFWRNVFGTLLCGLGIVVSDFLDREILNTPTAWRQWAAKEPWNFLVWLIPGVMIAYAIARSIVSVPIKFATVVWPLLASAAVACLWICTPQGTGWEDKQGEVLSWMALGVIAIVWNFYSLDAIALRGGLRWSGWVLVAHMAAASMFVLQSYASFGMWTLVGVAVAAAAALVGSLRLFSAQQSCSWQLSPITFGLSIQALTSMIVGAFYHSELPNRWLFGGLLFLPTVVSLVDLPFRKFNSWARAAIAAIVSCIILGTLAYQILSQKPEW